MVCQLCKCFDVGEGWTRVFLFPIAYPLLPVFPNLCLHKSRFVLSNESWFGNKPISRCGLICMTRSNILKANWWKLFRHYISSLSNVWQRKRRRKRKHVKREKTRELPTLPESTWQSDGGTTPRRPLPERIEGEYRARQLLPLKKPPYYGFRKLMLHNCNTFIYSVGRMIAESVYW